MVRPMHPQRGFTYLMLLWWVAISGVMLMALAQRWDTETRRQKEMDLVFRAGQIQSAIVSYAKVPVAKGSSNLPMQLEDLLEDRRSGQIVRHLRQLWPDPITGQAWGLSKQEVGIIGVYSPSKAMPLRAPDGFMQYDEWRFDAQVGSPVVLQADPP